MVGVAAPLEIPHIEAQPTGSRKRFSVRKSACCWAIAIDSVRTSAQHRNPLPGNFGGAGQYKRCVSPAHTVAGYRTAELAFAKNGNAAAGVRARQGRELSEKEIRSFFDRPIVRRMVAHTEVPFRLTRMMRGMR